MNVSVTPVDKIDVEELIKDFKVHNVDQFASYLKEVWKDLSLRSEDKSKGISKVTFTKYYDLPGIISERLFAVFDKNKNEYIDSAEFNEGMITLFVESYEKMLKFIFNFYDFDKDGTITKEDIRVVLSYIPLNTKQKADKLRYEKEDYKDRVESQDELHSLLEKCFTGIEKMDFNQFSETVEKVSSEIFLYILIFIMEKRPFSKKTLQEFEFHARKHSNSLGGSVHLKVNNLLNPNKLIASPSLTSKFSPSVTISKSPTMTKRMSEVQTNDSASILNKYSKNTTEASKQTLNKYVSGKNEEENKDDLHVKQPVKKNRINLKNIEDLSSQNKKVIKEQENLLDYDSDDNIEDIKFEGYLYKITHSKKLKKLWFKVLGKDLYYFKNKEEKAHKGMHNLSGVFIKEESETKIDDARFFCFSVIYPLKTRIYYVESEQEYQGWVRAIRKVTGYSSLTENYEIKEKLGKGKFGLVRLGVHKGTGRKAAVKIMNKKEMNNQDLELVKVEIDILKIGQHPNIIRLYDVFENSDYIYIIMEYCSGGDLFTYLEKRGFRLKEPRAAEMIHKLSTAIFFLHSYGIAHRDLKPENILMTDDSEEADIRLLDFGLSKIIGPNETCNEPYGTLSYVAPEILLEKPYTKVVDNWSIGIITYLLLCGCLPFDDENSEKEIARQTIYDPVPYHVSLWKNLSAEAKNFVDRLLQKDPLKRMSIKDCVEHPWIQKFHKSSINEIRRQSKDTKGSTFKIYTTTEHSQD